MSVYIYERERGRNYLAILGECSNRESVGYVESALIEIVKLWGYTGTCFHLSEIIVSTNTKLKESNIFNQSKINKKQLIVSPQGLSNHNFHVSKDNGGEGPRDPSTFMEPYVVYVCDCISS
jgi:hypothetical protein